MSTQIMDIGQSLIELRQQVAYWQSMHARAVEREQFWKAKALELEGVVRRQAAQLKSQAEQIEALKAQVCLLLPATPLDAATARPNYPPFLPSQKARSLPHQ